MVGSVLTHQQMPHARILQPAVASHKPIPVAALQTSLGSTVRSTQLPLSPVQDVQPIRHWCNVTPTRVRMLYVQDSRTQPFADRTIAVAVVQSGSLGLLKSLARVNCAALLHTNATACLVPTPLAMYFKVIAAVSIGRRSLYVTSFLRLWCATNAYPANLVCSLTLLKLICFRCIDYCPDNLRSWSNCSHDNDWQDLIAFSWFWHYNNISACFSALVLQPTSPQCVQCRRQILSQISVSRLTRWMHCVWMKFTLHLLQRNLTLCIYDFCVLQYLWQSPCKIASWLCKISGVSCKQERHALQFLYWQWPQTIAIIWSRCFLNDLAVHRFPHHCNWYQVYWHWDHMLLPISLLCAAFCVTRGQSQPCDCPSEQVACPPDAIYTVQRIDRCCVQYTCQCVANMGSCPSEMNCGTGLQPQPSIRGHQQPGWCCPVYTYDGMCCWNACCMCACALHSYSLQIRHISSILVAWRKWDSIFGVVAEYRRKGLLPTHRVVA